MSRTAWRLAIVCLLAVTVRLQAQSTEVPLGFVPKHERVLAKRGVQLGEGLVATSSFERETRPLAQASNIQQATFVDDVAVQQACGPCANPRFMPKLWFEANYLHWWTNGAAAPALASTSPSGTAQNVAGVLPDASVLYGNDDILDGSNSGARFTLGMWLNAEQLTSIQISYLYFDEDEAFASSGTDSGILARPFFNVSLDAEDSRLIEFPNLVTGSLSIQSSSELSSFEILLKRRRSTGFGNSRSEFLFGYRRADLNDFLRINETTTSLANPTLDTQFALFDEFQTDNEFHGAQFGISFDGPQIDCWSTNLLAKVALGNTTSRYTAVGQTVTTTATGDTSSVGSGLLVQDSNSGTVYDDEFSTVTELGISFRRQYECGWSINLGYTFFHWSEVARAVEQIDRRVNETQIPPNTLVGEALPARLLNRSDFWAQGISVGIEYRF